MCSGLRTLEQFEGESRVEGCVPVSHDPRLAGFVGGVSSLAGSDLLSLTANSVPAEIPWFTENTCLFLLACWAVVWMSQLGARKEYIYKYTYLSLVCSYTPSLFPSPRLWFPSYPHSVSLLFFLTYAITLSYFSLPLDFILSHIPLSIFFIYLYNMEKSMYTCIYVCIYIWKGVCVLHKHTYAYTCICQIPHNRIVYVVGIVTFLHCWDERASVTSLLWVTDRCLGHQSL